MNLKIGASIILLRNIELPRLCNGTRLIVKRLFRNIIEATIITGKYKNADVFIPKIPLTSTVYSFLLQRLQFPVKLSFAMTINKAQGQTMQFIGLNLSTACFTHGQLYVGCSRVTDEKNLFILAENGKTKNIVYKEIL